MHGEKVCVLARKETGRNELNEPLYEFIGEDVENVLVMPLTGQDTADSLRPDGAEIRYRLAFPKTYKGDLSHARIVLLERGMHPQDWENALNVVGKPDRINPCPTAWNMKVEVSRVDG